MKQQFTRSFSSSKQPTGLGSAAFCSVHGRCIRETTHTCWLKSGEENSGRSIQTDIFGRGLSFDPDYLISHTAGSEIDSHRVGPMGILLIKGDYLG